MNRYGQFFQVNDTLYHDWNFQVPRYSDPKLVPQRMTSLRTTQMNETPYNYLTILSSYLTVGPEVIRPRISTTVLIG